MLAEPMVRGGFKGKISRVKRPKSFDTKVEDGDGPIPDLLAAVFFNLSITRCKIKNPITQIWTFQKKSCFLIHSLFFLAFTIPVSCSTGHTRPA